MYRNNQFVIGFAKTLHLHTSDLPNSVTHNSRTIRCHCKIFTHCKAVMGNIKSSFHTIMLMDIEVTQHRSRKIGCV